MEQNWKKAKIHKNIANVASGLGKILEEKTAEKNILGAWGLVPTSVRTYPTILDLLGKFGQKVA